MRDIGLSEVETLLYPSDGKTDYGGWVMPLCWDAREATLEIIGPEVSEPLLCQYSRTPCSLMLNSRPADITAEVVMILKDEPLPPLKGKLVFITGQWPTMKNALAWFDQGAVGVISSVLGGGHFGKKGFEFLADSCQWYNYVIPHWPIKGKPVGFSLTPNQGARLEALIRNNAKVILRARVDSRLYPGKLPLVTGCLKGEISEDIIISAHLFEPGADDNASGVALALDITRKLMKQRLKRGIRLFFTYEVRSLQAYLNTNKKFQRTLAGINLDMVGFTENKQVTIGGNRPVFPNYSVPLLQYIFRKSPGYTMQLEGDFRAIDNAFGEPQTGIPLPYVILRDDPHYHKSSDTPATLSPVVLKTMGEAVGQYVSFLANAGYKEARVLARIVYKAEKDRLQVMTGNAGFNLALAKQSLASIKRVMTVVRKTDRLKIRFAQQKALARLLKSIGHKLDIQFKPTANIPAPAIPEADILRQLVPLKIFKGFFSFEKYINRKTGMKSIQEIICSWNAPAWVNHTLMWSDGKRTALDIFQMLLAWEPVVSPKLFVNLLQFMEKEGYLTIDRRPSKGRKTRPETAIAYSAL